MYYAKPTKSVYRYLTDKASRDLNFYLSVG